MRLVVITALNFNLFGFLPKVSASLALLQCCVAFRALFLLGRWTEGGSEPCTFVARNVIVNIAPTLEMGLIQSPGI